MPAKFTLRRSGKRAVTVQHRIPVYQEDFEKWRAVIAQNKRECGDDPTTTDAEVLDAIRSKMADATNFLWDYNDAGEYTGE